MDKEELKIRYRSLANQLYQLKRNVDDLNNQLKNMMFLIEGNLMIDNVGYQKKYIDDIKKKTQSNYQILERTIIPIITQKSR